MRALRIAVIAAFIGGAAISPGLAQESSEFGLVTALQAGWTIDRTLVFHDKPMLNPGSCGIVTNGYIIDENAPGHNLFNAMVLSALMNQREVAFVVYGCYEDRPQIISVTVR